MIEVVGLKGRRMWDMCLWARDGEKLVNDVWEESRRRFVHFLYIPQFLDRLYPLQKYDYIMACIAD